MKKILTMATLLFLTLAITTSVSATTASFPSNKVHIPHHTISNKKNTYEVQETEPNDETTIIQTKESKTYKELFSEEQVSYDKPVSILLFIVTFVAFNLFVLPCCIGCLHVIFDESKYISISKISMLSSKLGVTILLSSLSTIALFGLIYYTFSTITALACLYFGISILIFCGGYIFIYWNELGES